ncbi:DUF58 domain-containing protein [Bacillus sp. BRMEA1]|uniref:DUF58 domain-containing protein n=1 Tax=Neobacillus endophyticus TaxID=2738405 RepID=UPI00156308CE|nr:DUF58 domain-containing protein [Neobacillus endophyticus]NRD77666.1 DUF58 domain-containing protein [Neobacillus endophyticus]
MRKTLRLVSRAWKFVLLFLLLLLTFSYAMFQGGFVSWFLFYSFLPFSIYCLALSFYPLSEIEITRILPQKDYNAGEKLTVTIQFKRLKGFPLFYLIVEDDLPETIKNGRHSGAARIVLFPSVKKQFFYEYTMDELPRGEHVFRTMVLKAGDPLGLFEKEKTAKAEGKIVVYPAFTEFLYRPFESQYDQGLTASRERVQRDTTMAVGVRDYQPGDRFSWINWKATAKRNVIMTKEFEQRKSHDVFIMMDCVPDQRFEGVVSFTASLVRAVLKRGAQIGMLTVSNERVSFPIRGGEHQLQQLFLHLAKVEGNSVIPLEKVLETDRFFTQQSVSFMLVTAKLTKPLVEKAGILGSHKGSVTLFLIKSQMEMLTAQERALMAAANARGVRVLMVQEGNFAAVFSEVGAR